MSIRLLWIRWRNQGCLAVFWSEFSISWLIMRKYHEWVGVHMVGVVNYQRFCPSPNPFNINVKEWDKNRKDRYVKFVSDPNPGRIANVGPGRHQIQSDVDCI